MLSTWAAIIYCCCLAFEVYRRRPCLILSGGAGGGVINYGLSLRALAGRCFILYCYQCENKITQIVLFQKFSACF